MESNLLDLILLSDKRKNVLLLLLEGPKDIETLKKALNASATAVQPQVKKLKEQHLIVQEKNLYKLSDIGRVVVEKMKPLVDTLAVLEENTSYWAEREVNEIPHCLLQKISELGHCTIIEPQIDYMFELVPEYVKNVRMAKELRTAISYFHPLFPSFFLEIAEKGIPISLVIPEPILKRWVEDYREQTEQYLKKENAKLFVCMDCERIPAVAAADNFMAMALFPKSTVFDRKYVICFDPGARAWGKELYDYYEQRSKQIKNIDNYTQV